MFPAPSYVWALHIFTSNPRFFGATLIALDIASLMHISISIYSIIFFGGLAIKKIANNETKLFRVGNIGNFIRLYPINPPSIFHLLDQDVLNAFLQADQQLVLGCLQNMRGILGTCLQVVLKLSALCIKCSWAVSPRSASMMLSGFICFEIPQSLKSSTPSISPSYKYGTKQALPFGLMAIKYC